MAELVGAPSPTRTKLIIDTDPGIDDALAICLALGDSNAEVLALTTVFGNSPDVRRMSDNAQKVLNVAGRSDVPIHEGAATPLVTDGSPASYISECMKAQSVMIHGHDGLGDVEPCLPGKWTPNEVSAAECIVRLARTHPGEVVLVLLGPMTNLALALMICPDLTNLLKQVVVMGGALFSPRGNDINTPDSNRGNVTSSAEANIYKDPFSARKVVKAGFGPDKLVFVTLDLTTQTNYECSQISTLFDAAGALGHFLKQAHSHYVDVYTNRFGRSKVPFHDSCAVFFALCGASGASFETMDVVLDVETKGDLTFGMTVVDGRGIAGPANVRVCTTIVVDDLYNHIRQSVLALSKR
jgi:purine nucleosidase